MSKIKHSEDQEAAQLTIFYDGGCPLCVHEMRQLKRRTHAKHMEFEDIHQADFSKRYPQVDKDAANNILHAQTADGTFLYGLDVTHQAWKLAGRGWLTAPLRWPLIRFFADKCYLFFARHRYKISRLLTGRSRCEQCSLDD
ncbi:DUF393 domain-containing protein [Aliidiomarina minuta]|uniref:DUF393 domain-containing protein n=1 Tax=Aliidiomarina minuta TaxID=880057 RepID=A0A432W7F5_9GAMM|nr:DUF393 domain-containing protein [Aliidiomarina minuta]RUO25972.1 DUF393 domain-containing protein [Aliidiomarina minuta]